MRLGVKMRALQTAISFPRFSLILRKIPGDRWVSKVAPLSPANRGQGLLIFRAKLRASGGALGNDAPWVSKVAPLAPANRGQGLLIFRAKLRASGGALGNDAQNGGYSAAIRD